MAVGNVGNCKNRKLVGKVGSVKKISSTYRIEKSKTEKIMPPPVNHLGGHGRLGSKIGQLTVSW
jgi:cell shape-determining protein MreC